MAVISLPWWNGVADFWTNVTRNLWRHALAMTAP